MRKNSLTAIAILICIAGIWRASGQQQLPGGQAVTQSGVWNMGINAGSNTIGNVKLTDGSGNFQPTGDSAARTIHQTIDNASLPVTQSGAWNFGANAGTNKIGITYPYTSCGTTAFTKALQAMPTSSTAIAVATTCVLGIEVSNTSAGPLNVTISDNQGAPITFLNATPLNAGETRTYNWTNGRQFLSGIKVLASGAGVTYALEGLQ
jgi:hypothetical protein